MPPARGSIAVLREALGGAGAATSGWSRAATSSCPACFGGEHAYILQAPDRRVVFAIPFEDRFTLIGTTDVPYDGDPRRAATTPDEVAYLCDAVNRYFARPVRPDNVVWSYAGVRPLHDDASEDPSAITRDFALEVEAGEGRPALLSVFGGKITTYRCLAERALAILAPLLPGLAGPWTGRVPLPGGDLPDGDIDAFQAALQADKPWLPPGLARRLARAYGTRTARVLGGATCLADLGEDLGAGLTERELAYLVATEWARTADDVLWRRTKLGLHGGPALRERVESCLARTRDEGVVASPRPNA